MARDYVLKKVDDPLATAKKELQTVVDNFRSQGDVQTARGMIRAALMKIDAEQNNSEAKALLRKALMAVNSESDVLSKLQNLVGTQTTKNEEKKENPFLIENQGEQNIKNYQIGQNRQEEKTKKTAAQTNEEIVSLGNSLANYIFQLSVNPTSFYGESSARDIPGWGDEMRSTYSDLIGNDAGRLQQLKAYLRVAYADNSKLDMLISSVESSDKLNNSLKLLNATQRTVDGLNLLFQSSLGIVSVSDYQIKKYFQIDMFSGISISANQSTVDAVFAALKSYATENQIPTELVNLVFESNFGEKGQCLPGNFSYGYMNGEEFGGILNAPYAFYRSLVGKKDDLSFKKQLSQLRMLPLTYNELISQQPQGSDLQRPVFDMATILSFMSFYKYAKSNMPQLLTDSYTLDIVKAINGSGIVPAPNAVACTILQNPKTITQMYNDLPEKADFMAAFSNMVNGVSQIYSRPMGKPLPTGNRYDSAKGFVDGVGNIRGSDIMEDMAARFLDLTFTGNSDIVKLRSLYSFVLVGGKEEEINPIREILRSMMKEQGDFRNQDLQEAQVQQFVNQWPFLFANLTLKKKNTFYNQLRRLPSTYVYAEDRLLEKYLTYEWSAFQRMDANATNVLVHSQDKEKSYAKWQGNDNLQLTQISNGTVGTYANANSEKSEDFNAEIKNEKIYENFGAFANSFRMNSALMQEFLLNYIKTNKSTTTGGGTDGIYLESINDIAKNYASDHSDNPQGGQEEQTRYEQMVQRMRLKTPLADFYTEAYYDWDEKTKSRQFKLEAIVSDGNKYFRIANLDMRALMDYRNPKTGQSFHELVETHQKYAEAFQKKYKISTLTAAEYQEFEKPGVGENFNFGFVLGAANSKGDKRLAGLLAKTPGAGFISNPKPSERKGKRSGEFIGTAFGKFKGDTPVAVIEAGYLLYPENTSLQGGFGEKPINSTQSTSNSTVSTKKPLYFASAMTNYFYGLAVGNKEVLGLTARTQHLGGGMLMKFGNSGVQAYTADGEYLTDRLNVHAFVQGEKKRKAESSIRITTDLGKGYMLQIFGSTKGENKTDEKLYQNPGLIASINDFNKSMNDTLRSNNGSASSDDVRGWANDIFSIIQRLNAYMPGDDLTDFRNSGSITLEGNVDGREFQTKISVATMDLGQKSDPRQPKNDTGLYTVAVNTIQTGSNDYASFCFGVPVDAPKGNPLPDNIVGTKVKKGDLAIGLTGYNLLSDKPDSWKFDIAQVDKNLDWGVTFKKVENAWSTQGYVGFGKDHRIKTTVDIGNTKGTAFYQLAAQYALGKYYQDKVFAFSEFAKKHPDEVPKSSFEALEVGGGWTHQWRQSNLTVSLSWLRSLYGQARNDDVKIDVSAGVNF